jgi:hypothetical protein
LIEEFFKTNVKVSISKVPSPEFAAVIAVVKMVQPACDDESVARTMARWRKKIRSAKVAAHAATTVDTVYTAAAKNSQ